MLTPAEASDLKALAPFDTDLLDRLMDDAGIDVLLATSKHNVHYGLGGHRSIFFDYMDAIGVSRYLPVFIYPKGAPERAAYIGHRLEKFQRDVKPFWVAEAQTGASGCLDAMDKAIAYVKTLGRAPKRIGVETSFLPMDAAAALRDAFPDAEIVNVLPVLERLRARKTAAELKMLRKASDRVIDAMQATFAAARPGMTKQDVLDTLRREEGMRDMTFEYCLLTAGTGLNRAASGYVLQPGDIMSLDSGGNYHGYIGDVCRMGIIGEPDAELEDMLAEIESIQQAVFATIKPGALGRVIYDAGEPLVRKSRYQPMEFLAHGMGLVSHEAPRLTDSGPVPYKADDAERPLEEGMVISVETTLLHPKRGFIKLEDTVVVTASGYEVYGDRARGWNRMGTAAV